MMRTAGARGVAGGRREVRRARRKLIASLDYTSITPHFQPIVDVEAENVFAFEVLSRGPHPLESPEKLFGAARRQGFAWEVERACRLAALQKIASLPLELRSQRFFLNISPDALSDPHFVSGFTLAALEKLGIGQENVVLEITEKQTIDDYARYEETIRHYADQGFEIAVDDFGSGNSGIVTLISTRPQYIKLDMKITHDIDLHPYKQTIVRSLASFAQEVGATLIAEGIETAEELDAVRRLGVRLVQGWLFCPAVADPASAASIATDALRFAPLRVARAG